MMIVKLTKMGNSAGVLIPAAVRKSMKIEAGDDLMLTLDDGALILRPAKVAPHYTLAELLGKSKS